MIPLNKLPKDAQKAILTLIVLSGGATAASCCVPPICDPAPPPRSSTPSRSPIICDPPPPPRVTPTASRTPMICDPMPPRSATPSQRLTPSRTPIICDPMPPRSITPTASQTPITQRRFQLFGMRMTTDTTLKGAAVRGTVYDAQGQPLSGVRITVQITGTIIDATTDRGGSYFVRVPEPGNYLIIVGDDKNSALPLQLKQFDVANVDWTALGPASQLPLPLAEIRTIDILFDNSLTFGVETSWDGARFRWSVSGGELLEEADGSVTWQPPERPGRYLLQVIADWGQAGIAVDSMVLIVNDDESITFV